jgi:hypothetical protein
LTRELVAAVSGLDVPLPRQLVILREAATGAAGTTRLRAWGAEHLSLSGPSLDDWVARAWWGLVAGEVVRAHLYDERRRAAALELVDRPDWTIVEDAWQRGGVILAAAHVGPPKMAMNLLLDRGMRPVVWTNTSDMPAWQPGKTQACFLDPLHPDERAVLLVRSALHLRAGGILFGAPDWPTGQRLVTLHRLGTGWTFSVGLPALARLVRTPAFLVLALWHDDRLRMTISPIARPAGAMGEHDWDVAWLEGYWRGIESVIRTSPENLRFLRTIDGGSIRREVGL